MSENKEKSAFHNFIDDSFFSYQFLTFGLIFGVAGSALIIVGAVLGTQLNKNTVSDFVNSNTLSQNSQALSYWQNPGVEVLTYTIPNVNIDSVAGGNITCGSSVTTTYSLQLNRVNLTFSADGNSVDYRLQRLVTPEATSANFTVNTLDLSYLYAVNNKGDEPTLANTIDTSVKGFKSVGDFFNTKLTGVFGAQKVASGIAKSIADTYPAILTQFATDYYNAALEYPMKRVAGTLFAGPVVSGLLSGCGSTAAAACTGLASNTPTATCSSASFYSIFNTFAKTSTNACTAVLSLGSAAPELLYSKSTQLYLCKTPATLLTTLQKTVAAITQAEVNTLCTTSLPKLISDYNTTQTNVYSVLDSVTKDNTGILPNKNPSIPIGLDVINSVNGEQGILKLANPPASVAGLTVDYIKADANIQAFVAQNTDFFKKWYSVLLWASNSTRTTTQSFTGLAVNTNLTNSVMQLVANATLDAKVTSFLPGLLFDSANAAYLQVGGAIDTKTLEPFPTLGAAGNVLGIATGSSSVASSIASVPSITAYISSLIQSYTDTTQQALGQLLYANAYPDGIMKAFFSTPYLPSVELGLVINNTNYFTAADYDEWLANKNGSKNTLSGTLATLGNANPFLSVGTGSLTAKYMRYIYYNIYLKLVTDNLSGNTGGVAAVTFGAAINQKLVSTLLNKADNGKVNTLIGFQIPNAAGWEPLTTTTIDTAYYTDLTGANGSKSAYQSATAGFDGFEYHFAPDFVQTGKSLTFLSTANSQINTLPVQCVGTVSDSIYSTDAVQCQYAKPSTLPTKNSYLQEITTSASNAVIAARFLVPCELASSLFNATAPMCSAGFDSNQHGTFVNVQSATGMTLSARTCFLSVSEITVPGTTLSAPSLANKQIVTNDYMRLSTYLGTSAQINAFTGSVNDANAKSRAILIALVVVGAVLFAVSIPLFVFYGIKKSRANKATAKEDLVKDPFHEMNDRFARVAA